MADVAPGSRHLPHGDGKRTAGRNPEVDTPESGAGAGARAIAGDDLKSLPLLEVEKRLGFSPDGLSQAEAQRRLVEYGPNEIEEQTTNQLLALLAYFWGPIPWMIEAAVILSGLLGTGRTSSSFWSCWSPTPGSGSEKSTRRARRSRR